MKCAVSVAVWKELCDCSAEGELGLPRFHSSHYELCCFLVLKNNMETLLTRAITLLKGIQQNFNYIQNPPSQKTLRRTRDCVSALSGTLSEFKTNVTEMNPVTSQMALETLNSYLDKLFDLSAAWAQNMTSKDNNSMLVFLSKLDTFCQIIRPAFTFPADDLIILDKNHKRWIKLDEIISYREIGDPEALAKEFSHVFTNVEKVISILSKSLHLENSLFKKLALGYNIMKYGLSARKAREQAELTKANPDPQVMISVCNMLDSKLGGKLMEAFLTNIAVNELIYVPRTACHVLERSGSSLVRRISLTPEAQIPHFSLRNNSRRSKIQIRVLHNAPVPLISQLKLSRPRCFCEEFPGCGRSIVSDSLIVHFHGGGFIAMSSKSHQSYTRKWANSLNVPVLSVDYRLSPEHPFPDGLDDVWQVYHWVLQHAERQLGISPKKVLLAGDSAGGNLVLALTLRLIQTNERAPDGLLLSYPAVNLKKHRFSPSLLRSLEDRLLSHTFMNLMRESYLRDNDSHMLTSPSEAPAEYFRSFPKTRILVGSLDPLYDDSLRLAEKLLSAGVDVKVQVYLNAVHGVLSFGAKAGVKACGHIVRDSIQLLEDLLK